MTERLLPPNLELALAELVRRGPLAGWELVNALHEQGIRLSLDRVESLPDRYADYFGRDDQGRLVPAVATASESTEDDAATAPSEALPWTALPRPTPADPERLLVLTTTPGTADNQIEAVLFRPWDDAVFRHLGPDDDADLVAFCDRASGVTGYGLRTVPALVQSLATLGESLPGARIDVLELSLLTHPSLVGRALSDLCEELGRSLPTTDPVDYARAVAGALVDLLAQVDPDEPSWRLTLGCLLAGGSDLVRVLPDGELPATIEEALQCRPDSLLTGPFPSHPTSAVPAARGTWEALEATGLSRRHSQHEMASAISAVLDGGGRLAVEAPTGTGKSLAYLVPTASRSGARPAALATATKVLQRQLRDDAERLHRLGRLGAPFRQLFGVANYVCTREVAVALQPDDPSADHWLATAVAVRALATTDTGVWDDVTDRVFQLGLPHYAMARAALRTDAESCERTKCAWVAQCPLYQRLDGMHAAPGTLAINHAMLGSWTKAAATGRRVPANLLEEGRADFVIDEAHDLEDSLTAAWTETLGHQGLAVLGARLDGRLGIARSLRRVARLGADVGNPALMRELRSQLGAAEASFGAAVREYVHDYAGGGDDAVVLRAGVVQARPEYRRIRGESFGLERAFNAIAAALAQIAHNAHESPHLEGRAAAPLRRLLANAAGVRARIDEARELLDAIRVLGDDHLQLYRLVAEKVDADTVELSGLPWRFERIPIDVGPAFAEGLVDRAYSVTLTSATLTTRGTFDFLGSRLGITVTPGSAEGDAFDGRCLTSPFNYPAQSAVVLTNHLPVPVPTQEDEFVRELARDQIGLLSITGGRTLTLFAARTRMEAVAALVREREHELHDRGVRLLVQGEAGRQETARRFRDDPGTVLYGLRSYWQGFDAPGETLSYLVIEKPPYPHPRDHVVAARVRAIADRGGDPFLEYIAPKTAIQLAQGFGRLIRTETDRGVALICDRRMQSPTVANQILLSALPSPTLHHARDRDDAWRFAIRFVTGKEPDLTDALALAAGNVELLLLRLRLKPGEDPRAKLDEAARELFGIEQMRPEQLELMLAHLAGRDAIGVLPTGSGKSLCFQLPALLRAENRATVVVSPLVALIKDQVDDLRSRRGLSEVQGISSTTSGSLRTEILRDVADGRVRLLYVSPERLVRDPVLRKALARQELGGLVVDEAHCVSAWGHDFRPEFRRVAAAVDEFQRAPRLALTATATRPVRDDVIATLELRDPLVIQTPADRPNLRLWVHKVGSERERARELLRIVTAMGERPGIVYASRRVTTEELAALLRRAGLAARHYHAGMVPEQREAVQEDFFAGTAQIIVATKAFGMGVNKPDIGWVVHYDLPDSLDSYVQEAGRAARSAELVGECVLLYGETDIRRRFAQIEGAGEDVQVARARTALDLLGKARRRNDDVVFDAEAFAEEVGLQVDELNVALGWLERSGALVQLADCSARGTLTPGIKDPEDEAERRRFREITALIGTRPMVASRIDFDRLQDQYGMDPDALEQDLVSWSLDRVVTFSASQRYRRARLKTDHVDEATLRDQIADWRTWQKAQLTAMTGYARNGGCRRAAIVTYFGHASAGCGPTQQQCDRCSGAEPPWAALPDSLVPDPESLVDVALVVLQAVAWASSLQKGKYGEGGLKAAVLGQEAIAGRPLGRGLMCCPQFGALRFLRAGDRRWDAAVAAHLNSDRITREQVEGNARTYSSLTLAEAGRVDLGGRRG